LVCCFAKIVAGLVPLQLVGVDRDFHLRSAIRRQRPRLQGWDHRQTPRLGSSSFDRLPPAVWALPFLPPSKVVPEPPSSAKLLVCWLDTGHDGEWCGCSNELAVAAVSWAAARQGLGLGATIDPAIADQILAAATPRSRQRSFWVIALIVVALIALMIVLGA
jgi:hypothetical protein